MKTKSLLVMMALVAIFSFVSCSKDNDSSNKAITADDATANSKMDQASNDISDVTEDQYLQQNPTASGKTTTVPVSILPPCATVTTVVTSTDWTRTVDFGTTGCPMPNGNVLKGKIIVSGSLDFSSPYTIHYSFDNFYHNGILIQGNNTTTRTFGTSASSSTAHPIHLININMTATFPNGDVYTRVGTRTRECIANFGNGNWGDNVYVFFGTVTTTKPDGSHHTNAILEATPLRIDMGCQYRLVSGIVTISNSNHSAVVDYGAGTCDNNATISIDGGTPVAFTFGN
ncbi:MAG TPA: hypothetical protein PKN96_03895 [Flavobacterium sp.]|uniref:hypothetical protein n=1 Tax=Flavobacterium sp. TaxID=239 RepID=UPI002C2D9803|nr:hypothetical protein [Flavobacterium sp.]HNP32408.1 hypothetical protein [Flavobacterium sp.]